MIFKDAKMSRSLYPTTLFHFTRKIDALKMMLEMMSFKVSYAREFVQGPTTNRNFAVPMVSFCDIRLSQLADHTDNYGKFGIGLTKIWAEKNGLNPVNYVSKGSKTFDNYNTRLREIYSNYLKLKVKANKSNSEIKMEVKLKKEYADLVDMMRYIKNYEGTLRRHGMSDKSGYRFADEREWRFVPDMLTDGIVSVVAPNNIKTKEQKDYYNEMASKINLPFTYEDIKYIIVEAEEDVEDISNFISIQTQELKHISKIVCAKQINDDL